MCQLSTIDPLHGLLNPFPGPRQSIADSPLSQVLLRRHQQMIMVGHQAVRMHPQAELFDHLRECLQEPAAVVVVAEDLAAFVSSCHDMVNGSRKFNTHSSWHEPVLAIRTQNVNCQRLTPVTDPGEPPVKLTNVTWMCSRPVQEEETLQGTAAIEMSEAIVNLTVRHATASMESRTLRMAEDGARRPGG